MNKISIAFFFAFSMVLLLGSSATSDQYGECFLPKTPIYLEECTKLTCVHYCGEHYGTWENGACFGEDHCCCVT
ncbi:hypothetical protein vseg_014306 [Gypsophila vaccaria]